MWPQFVPAPHSSATGPSFTMVVSSRLLCALSVLLVALVTLSHGDVYLFEGDASSGCNNVTTPCVWLFDHDRKPWCSMLPSGTTVNGTKSLFFVNVNFTVSYFSDFLCRPKDFIAKRSYLQEQQCTQDDTLEIILNGAAYHSYQTTHYDYSHCQKWLR